MKYSEGLAGIGPFHTDFMQLMATQLFMHLPFFRKPNIHCRVHKSLSLIIKGNSVEILMSYSFKVYFNILLSSSTGLFLLVFQPKIFPISLSFV